MASNNRVNKLKQHFKQTAKSANIKAGTCCEQTGHSVYMYKP